MQQTTPLKILSFTSKAEASWVTLLCHMYLPPSKDHALSWVSIVSLLIFSTSTVFACTPSFPVILASAEYSMPLPPGDGHPGWFWMSTPIGKAWVLVHMSKTSSKVCMEERKGVLFSDDACANEEGMENRHGDLELKWVNYSSHLEFTFAGHNLCPDSLTSFSWQHHDFVQGDYFLLHPGATLVDLWITTALLRPPWPRGSSGAWLSRRR